MRKISFLALIIFLFAFCGDDSKQLTIDEKKDEDPIKRGELLTLVGGCNDCHSPKNFSEQGPQVDPSRRLSGHPAGSPLPPVDMNALKPGHWILFAPDLTAAVGPWGISFAANLTPDSTTGIGGWTETDFIQTLRTGKHLGHQNGRPILPPMPWQELGKLSDEDLKAIFAYLNTLQPIRNQVPAPVPPNDVLSFVRERNATAGNQSR